VHDGLDQPAFYRLGEVLRSGTSSPLQIIIVNECRYWWSRVSHQLKIFGVSIPSSRRARRPIAQVLGTNPACEGYFFIWKRLPSYSLLLSAQMVFKQLVSSDIPRVYSRD
jgi:hypothetical protein